MKVTEDFVFFWGGILSNWAETPIEIPSMSIVLPTSEHYFMYLKSIYFNDSDTANKIITSVTPKEAKKLGRKVKGFSDDLWVNRREEAMMESIRLKFKCSKLFRDELLNDEYIDKLFVEASPYDRIWGIGKSETDLDLLDTSNWGLNLLGKCLSKLREENS